MNPVILAALINEIAIPELGRWLAELHVEGRVVSDEEALSKLHMDVDDGNASGHAFLGTHPRTT